MTTKAFKKFIKEKFGTMAKFAKLIKVDRYELQKFFAASEKKMTPERKTKLQEMVKLAKATKNGTIDSDLTAILRKKMSDAITEQFGGVPELCLKHPEFNTFSVWQILNGRRKTISANVKKLLQILKIEDRV